MLSFLDKKYYNSCYATMCLLAIFVIHVMIWSMANILIILVGAHILQYVWCLLLLKIWNYLCYVATNDNNSFFIMMWSLVKHLYAVFNIHFMLWCVSLPEMPVIPPLLLATYSIVYGSKTVISYTLLTRRIWGG